MSKRKTKLQLLLTLVLLASAFFILNAGQTQASFSGNGPAKSGVNASGDVSLQVNFTVDDAVYFTSVAGDNTLEFPVDPLKQGYNFAGWYTDGEARFSFGPSGSMAYITMQAVFTQGSGSTVDYLINFDSNGGSAVPSINITSGGMFSFAEDPVRTGYVFKGWFVDNEIFYRAFNFFYFAGQTISTDVITVYAKWEVAEYDITYILDGGENDINNPSSYTVESVFTLNNPVKEGYVFTGWTFANVTTPQQNFVVENSTGNLVFTANWSLRVTETLTVTSTSGGSWAINLSPFTSGQTVPFNTYISLTATPGFGYSVEWYSGGVLVSTSLTYSFNMPAKNVALHAKFQLYNGGSGTESDPYIISEADKLEYLAYMVNNDNNYSLNKYFELGANIDLGGVEWMPIGYLYNPNTSDIRTFRGSFDGKGYTVSDFIITRNNCVYPYYFCAGLFGCINGSTAVIKNLGVENFTIDAIDVIHTISSAYIGGLVGYSYGGNISNCYVIGSISKAGSGSYVGGLVGYLASLGYNQGCSITDSYAACDIYVNLTVSTACAGGLVGSGSGFFVSNSYATGNVYASTIGNNSPRAYAGGLVGSGKASVSDCYATGDVYANSTSFNTYAGGLAAYFSAGSVILNCYAAGNVNAAGYEIHAGGFLGIAEGPGNYWEDGVFISNSYATGDISASSSAYIFAGGLVGSGKVSVSDCYATGNVYANSVSFNVYAGGLVGYLGVYNYSYNQGSGIFNSYATGNVIAINNYSSIYAGGLLGYNYGSNTISNCYAAGNVSGEGQPVSSNSVYVGGVFGNANGGTYVNCYRYAGQIFYCKSGSTVKTTPFDAGHPICSLTNLNDLNFYITTLGWDANIWDFSNLNFLSGCYPKLYWQV